MFMGLNFEIMFVMVVMICWYSVLILVTLLLSLYKVLTIITIYGISKSDPIKTIMRLTIVDIYKMHTKKIQIKNWVFKFYFDNLVKAKKFENNNILMGEKHCKDLAIYFTRCVYSKSIKMFESLLSLINGKD